MRSGGLFFSLSSFTFYFERTQMEYFFQLRVGDNLSCYLIQQGQHLRVKVLQRDET